MALRTCILVLLLFVPALAQEYICPMDKDVHSAEPGKCPRCGMTLEAHLPDEVEYRVKLDPTQDASTLHLRFRVIDPRTLKTVERFRTMHEKRYHLFLVKDDLTYFAHLHPDSNLDISIPLPPPGMYRTLSDFYPEGGTPQLVPSTVFVYGHGTVPAEPPWNLEAALTTEPAAVLAGRKTLLFFDLKPFDGVEPYLGVWGHMLVASEDLIDLMHEHPAYDPREGRIQFNVIFPRPGLHKVWVQFQRNGQVNTFSFMVKVSALQ